MVIAYNRINTNMKIKCSICNKEYSSKGIGTHIWRSHGEGQSHKPMKNNPVAWNKGLTKEDPRILKISQKVSESTKGRPRRNLSEQDKKKISHSMKLAHAEGRAWNIGQSRWNNKPSYPETFFMKVIQNEFHDKNYSREYAIGIYSLDFAWIDKKLCIEIDGDQHQRFQEYKDRDKRKDLFLNENGWKILRISWREMFNDSKYWINIANQFIGQ